MCIRDRTGLEEQGHQVLLARKSKYLEDSVTESTVKWAGGRFPLDDGILFVGACGIAVRSIAPYVAVSYTHLDELEYQEEYIGAWGLNGSNFAMALAILINSVGYSRNYISGSRETAFRFMIAVVIFVVCFFYEGLWQMRYVKVIQSSRPEFSNADPSSMKFQEQWMKSCDEAEKEMIYHSSYRTYLFLSKVIPILLVAAMLSNLLFDTGMLAIVLLAVLWIMTSMYYTRSCVNMRKKRARG